MYRLTVHLENASRVDTMAPKSSKPKKTKTAVESALEQPKKSKTNQSVNGRFKVFNTLSFYCDTKEACMKKLNDVRKQHTIAVGTNPAKPHKLDKELWYISFVN